MTKKYTGIESLCNSFIYEFILFLIRTRSNFHHTDFHAKLLRILLSKALIDIREEKMLWEDEFVNTIKPC